MKDKLKFYAERQMHLNCFNLYLDGGLSEGNQVIAKPVEFEVLETGRYVPTAPMLTLSKDEAQRLMDELWFVGLRPSEGSGSAGNLAATERHLKDMQAIAMGLLRKENVAI